MKRFLKKRKMRGFTLVELLIVIIIIGILAGALLLVAGAGTDKAEATKVISDLRSIKSAALLYYADFSEWPGSGDTGATWFTSWDNYTDRAISTDKFDIEVAGSNIFIKYTDLKGKDGVIKKLADEATKNGGLFGTASDTDDFTTTDNAIFIKLK